MSPIGRIFMFLNLVLAAAFLGWAANALGTSEEWKQKHDAKAEEMTAALDEKQTEIDDLQQEANGAKQQSSQFLRERDDAQGELDRVTTDRDEKKRANEGLRGDLTAIRSTLGDYNDTNKQLTAAKDRAVERAHEMERARDDAQQASQEAEFAKRDADDKAKQATSRIAALETDKQRLTSLVDQKEAEIVTLVAQTGAVRGRAGQPQIEGAVLQVRLDLPPGLVMLNVGQQDGVTRGMTFDIFRGNKYKGQVKVENVQEKLCSATLQKPVPGVQIRQGDKASTHL